jgi:ketosteroid isomerase-like protein
MTDFSAREREVQDLLDQLARAITAGDGRAVARLWDVPALVLSDANVQPVTAAAEIEQFFGGAKEQYNAQGITDTRPEIVRLTWATERLAIAEVDWPYLDAAGARRGLETSTYTFRRDDAGQLRLRVAVLHGARPS